MKKILLVVLMSLFIQGCSTFDKLSSSVKDDKIGINTQGMQVFANQILNDFNVHYVPSHIVVTIDPSVNQVMLPFIKKELSMAGYHFLHDTYSKRNKKVKTVVFKYQIDILRHGLFEKNILMKVYMNDLQLNHLFEPDKAGNVFLKTSSKVKK